MPIPVRDRDPAQRVVVTGWGAVTSLGTGVTATFDAMQAARSGVGEISRFDAAGLPCGIAGELDADALAPAMPLDGVGGTALRIYRTALKEALPEGRIPNGIRPERAHVILGGHAYTPTEQDSIRILRHVREDGSVDRKALAADATYGAIQLTERLPDTVPALVARTVGAEGGCLPIVSACAAGTQALGEATRLLRDGGADLVVSGGVEPLLTYSYFVGFALLGALVRRYPSPEAASRPFDRRRNGFVIAEGAGALILETLEGARRRGRPVLGEILGYGDSSDAYRITDVHPQGDGALRAMQGALDDAGLPPDAVEYVNAHGTSTPTNDPVETIAIKRLLGERAMEVPVSSNKSMIGHTIGAAGAIEAILTLEGMRRGVVLPTINQEAPDRKCDLDYVPNVAREVVHRTAISNSFGFGGQNGCVCLGAAE